LIWKAVKYQLRDLGKVLIWYLANRHRPGHAKNLWVFGARRSGTTLLAQVIGANRGVKICHGPFSIPSSTVLQFSYVFQFTNGQALDLLDEEKAICIDYVNSIRKGRLHVGEPWRIWGPNFHLRSDRLVFQAVASSGLAPLMYETYKDHIIFLCRHPIPQSISCLRNRFPLNFRSFLSSRWYVESYLKDGLEGYCHDLLHSDQQLDKYVLVWCLENRPLFANLQDYPDWAFVTYEHFVQHSADVIAELSTLYGLPDVNEMLRVAKRPSISTRTLSTSAAKDAIRKGDSESMLFGWRARISKEDEKHLMAIVERFEIDEYKVFESRSTIGYRPPAPMAARDWRSHRPGSTQPSAVHVNSPHQL
jgi:hypothetical protein